MKWENRSMASVWSKKDEKNTVVICDDLKTKQSASDFVSSCSLEGLTGTLPTHSGPGVKHSGPETELLKFSVPS